VSGTEVESLLRRLAPQVLGAVVRRYGNFDTAEDAVQEALLAAATQWPNDGVPENPKGWLITVAARRLTDVLRSEQARRRREDTVARWAPPQQQADVSDKPGDSDDTLILLFMCCHPALSAPSQIALTLRAVGGLTTTEVARAFLVSEATMTRRITRAKQQIKDSGIPFRLPGEAERSERLAAVLHVLYLIFTEGYAATTGPRLHRVELSTEAIRLAKMVHKALPDDDAEVAGLLALMLLIDARRAARTTGDGELVPLAEQDRRLWNADDIAEGVALITEALLRGTPGSYQLQAAIAAIHDESPSAEETDWRQIKALYELLLQLADNPIIALNHVVAVAMVDGAATGLQQLETLATDKQLAEDHRLYAVRAHLLEMTGDAAAAREAYRAAARRASNLTQQRYLNRRAARLDEANCS
jgi:RNA polymerase sigma factor (sigma-70 family)